MLDFMAGTTWATEDDRGSPAAGYHVPFDTFATARERVTQRYPHAASGEKVVGGENYYNGPPTTSTYL